MMRTTKKQLEVELAAAKQEIETWKAAHAALAGAMSERQPYWYYPTWTGTTIPNVPTWGGLTIGDSTHSFVETFKVSP